jgi:hypothetical protein
LVFIGFSFLGLVFCFGFPGLFILPVHVVMRGDRLKPATTAQFFLIALPAAL